MTDDGVQTAFVLILEELGSVANDYMREAKRIAETGTFKELKALSSKGEALEDFQLKVCALRDEWVGSFDEVTRGKTYYDVPILETPDINVVALHVVYGDASAKAEYIKGKVRLLPGSTIRKESKGSLNEATRKRKTNALYTGDLKESSNPELLVVNTPIVFDSPSGAAYFVAGCSVSGPRDWEVVGHNLSLNGWILQQRVQNTH
ncbi:DUF4357 domain-containing protein [Thiocapsa rosea]|uniref:Uncharacterized protein DUF4357 n=1 Tax=Thiocapsa rosea TaxID=69360 RepID=A0A495VE11_9GAMM|nr:DUF4357 domain-containing protein [Thiocapsa rosea]RKT47040.1 uncharacterized protein DUF4357 [Thiocapsa rosea]